MPNLVNARAITTNVADGLAYMASVRNLELVQTGGLEPGPIGNEPGLAKQFSMSRGPIREAARPGRCKLIVREAHQRARITPLENEIPKEIFDLRACLEGLACRLATLPMAKPEMPRFGQETESSRRIATARQ